MIRSLRDYAGRRWLGFAGVVLLVMCGWWWASSVRLDKLRGAQHTWVPALNLLGADFLSNYYASRHWVAGGNPYREPFGDPLGRPLTYAPVLLPLFSWCAWLERHAAVYLWMGAIAVSAALGAVVSWRARHRLGLWEVPLPFVLGAVLCSTPIVFALERGNCDVLVLLLIIVAVVALRGSSVFRDLVAGVCVGLAAWLKIYPAILLPGLLALRRPRAALFVGLTFVAIGTAQIPYLPHYVESNRAYVAAYDIETHLSAHPFGTYWKHLWEGTRLDRLARIPGIVGATGTLLPLVLWVGYHVFRCRERAELRYPYFCWLTAVATFFPPVSNDYNLFFLPLAGLAVWDRRDPVIVHLLMALLLLWWQPVQLSVGPRLLFAFKLMGLFAVGLCIVKRAREQSEVVTTQHGKERDLSTRVLSSRLGENAAA